MPIDKDKLQLLIAHEPLAVAAKQFGNDGPRHVKNILHFLRRCGRHATVDASTNLTVFALLTTDPSVESLRPVNASLFEFGVSAKGTIGSLSVEIRADGSAYSWKTVPAEVAAIIPTGICYRLEQSLEKFTIGGGDVVVDKIMDGSVSQFVVNYFTDLKEALVAYRESMARSAQCYLLREAWPDGNRIWFVTKPEWRLRRSLCNFLRARLRYDDISLRPEQNVDESHPVDIKVVWRDENRSAIIEVKWIGKSVDSATGQFTADYADARARAGAKQLAEYLESHKTESALEDTRGYLVVFDTRRRGVKPDATSVSKVAGFFYADKELAYDPEYHKTRVDFEEPIRLFLEPVCV